MKLLNNNSIKFAGIVANTAFDTFVLVQLMRGFLFAGDDIFRASFCTQGASGAGFRIDFVVEQILADTCRAFFVLDMGFVLVTEIIDGCDHRIWSGKSTGDGKKE